jgi:hypothetical protein
MISFLNPIFLAFGAAVLIPLVLHMIQSSRTVRLPFSTVRFLKLAQKRSSRRIKMENFLLWLLRTLLMALLALAFAMPMLRARDFGNLLGRAARDVAIVIDASYSMDYRMGRQMVWDQATDLAASIIEGLSEKDRFCVYLAGDQVTPICEQLTNKKEETATRLRALPMPHGSSQLCPATLAALGALDQDVNQADRELHIISDHQLLPWSRFKPSDTNAPAAPPAEAREGLWDPALVKDNTTCFVTLLGASVPENAAPIEVALEPALITPEIPCQATVRFLRSGPRTETAAALFVDDKEVGRRSVTLVDGVANETKFMIPLREPGIHAVRVETPDDSLAEDNAFHFLIRVREKLPALCVGSKDGTLFLRAALGTSLDGASPFEIKSIAAEGLAGETLSSYACIFLCNVMPLAGQDIRALERYVATGGLLVVFPGDGGAMADYGAWTCLPAFPTSITDVPAADRKRLLNWDKPQHPVVYGLKEGGISPSVSIKRQLNCETLAEKAETLVSTGAGHPFLIVRPSGRGATVLCTVSADRSWSDFPLSPFYLPLAHQLIQYAAAVGAGVPYLWAVDSLPLEEFLPEATRESVLKGPDGKPLPIRSAVVEGETVSYAEGLTAPGVYRLSEPGGAGDLPALAINMHRGESDLTPVKAEDLPAMLGLETLQVATSKDELMKKIDDFRVGRTLGEPLLWLALLVALLESFYSNALLRKSSKLTDSLMIAPSGKVKAKDS